MNAVVIEFPTERRKRAKPFIAGCGFLPPTLEGRVRAVGYHYGLPQVKREALVALHRQWLGLGLDDEEILRRVSRSAKAMLTTKPPESAA